MRKFVASTPEAEIIGQALLALHTSIFTNEIKSTLKKQGLDKINPNQWYPQQSVLNIHRELAISPNGSRKIISIGVKIAESLPFPEGSSMEDALQMFSDLHLQVHRNISTEDRFRFKRSGEYSFEIINDSPYPDDLVYGYVYSLMNRFCPGGTYPILRYLDPDKINADTSMVYELTW